MGGSEGVLCHGVNGVVPENHSFEAMADAISRVVSSDEGKEMGQRGTSLARLLFSPARSAQSYAQAFVSAFRAATTTPFPPHTGGFLALSQRKQTHEADFGKYKQRSDSVDDGRTGIKFCGILSDRLPLPPTALRNGLRSIAVVS